MDSTTERPEVSGEGQLSAWRSPAAHVRFWVTAAIGVALDLWSKRVVFATLDPDTSKPIIPKVIEFHRSLNDGAVFGSFTGQVGLFVIASLFALAFVTYIFLRSERGQWGVQIALALVFSGAVGNLYDRIIVQADVVTFVTSAGRETTFIGKIVEDGDEFLKVAHWPDGDGRVLVLHKEHDDVRVRKQGVVRDFIRFVPRFPEWVPRFGGREMWPWVFNIADAALVIGVAVLLLSSWVHKHESS